MVYETLTCAGLFCVLLFKYRNPLFILLIASALLATFFPQIFTNFTSDHNQLYALTNYSAKAFVFLLVALTTPKYFIKYIPHICFLNSLWVILYPQHYGLGMSTSVDSMLIAIMYPLVIKWVTDARWLKLFWRAIILAVPVFAIFIAKGSVGIGGLCLGLAVFYMRRPLGLLIPALLFFAYFIYDPAVFNDSARFICWEWSMKWWWANANHWIGTGFGTYGLLGPMIQILESKMIGTWYAEMHNDWLQCLFEFGYIGLAIAISTVGWLIYRVRHDKYLLSTVITFAACAFLYYPTRNIVLAALAVSVIKTASSNMTMKVSCG